MKTNYVLIDYENVKPDNLSLLIEHDFFKVIVFVGANQEKIPFDLAAALQSLGNKAEYVKISGNGSNALDFHIAYYIGVLSAREKGHCFYIVSKDTGFDPLIEHLKEKKVPAQRVKDIVEILNITSKNKDEKQVASKVDTFKATPLDQKIEKVVGDLVKRGQSRPRKVSTLSTTINSLFMKKLKESDILEIINKMKKEKLIVVDKEAVRYNLPK